LTGIILTVSYFGSGCLEYTAFKLIKNRFSSFFDFKDQERLQPYTALLQNRFSNCELGISQGRKDGRRLWVKATNAPYKS